MITFMMTTLLLLRADGVGEEGILTLVLIVPAIPRSIEDDITILRGVRVRRLRYCQIGLMRMEGR